MIQGLPDLATVAAFAAPAALQTLCLVGHGGPGWLLLGGGAAGVFDAGAATLAALAELAPLLAPPLVTVSVLGCHTGDAVEGVTSGVAWAGSIARSLGAGAGQAVRVDLVAGALPATALRQPPLRSWAWGADGAAVALPAALAACEQPAGAATEAAALQDLFPGRAIVVVAPPLATAEARLRGCVRAPGQRRLRDVLGFASEDGWLVRTSAYDDVAWYLAR